MSKTYKITVSIAAVILLGCGFRWIQDKRTEVPLESCWARLSDMDRLKQQWALETGKTTSVSPTWEELLRFQHSAYGNHWYDNRGVCPQGGGAYIIGIVGERPKCRIREHNTE